MVPGTDTALLYLDSFSTGSADAVIKALKEIKTAGADRLIFDLRGNPGGYVNEAVKIASQFLSEGVVYIDRDADGNETPQKVTPGGVALDIPMVVLVDANTASSSEIVSGALQDAGRAQIVGVTTFGTGTVLGEFELSDKSALRIGTVEWLTPKGRQIWHDGHHAGRGRGAPERRAATGPGRHPRPDRRPRSRRSTIRSSRRRSNSAPSASARPPRFRRARPVRPASESPAVCLSAASGWWGRDRHQRD